MQTCRALVHCEREVDLVFERVLIFFGKEEIRWKARDESSLEVLI